MCQHVEERELLFRAGTLHRHVARFRQGCTLDDAIGSHACTLEANMRVTNGIPLRCPLLLPGHTVNSVQTLKAFGTPLARMLGAVGAQPSTGGSASLKERNRTTGSPASNSVKRAKGSPASNSVKRANGSPASNSVKRAKGSPVSNSVKHTKGSPVSDSVTHTQ
jgi:hypothetical protein